MLKLDARPQPLPSPRCGAPMYCTARAVHTESWPQSKRGQELATRCSAARHVPRSARHCTARAVHHRIMGGRRGLVLPRIPVGSVTTLDRAASSLCAPLRRGVLQSRGGT